MEEEVAIDDIETLARKTFDTLKRTYTYLGTNWETLPKIQKLFWIQTVSVVSSLAFRNLQNRVDELHIDSFKRQLDEL